VLSPADSIVEEELRQQLVGKPLYLRGGYLSDNLNFDQHGRLLGSSPRSSYTLSAIEIDRVRLTRRKVELEGIRYGLHFLGALPYEDPTKALDRVRITPKKKLVKLTIDREIVIKPKAIKEKGEGRLWGRKVKDDAWTAEEQLPEVSEANQATAPAAAAPAAASTPAPAASEAPASTPAAALEASAATPVAVAPETERTADLESGTTTSPAYAAAMLKSALDRIFAPGLDDRMMAAMPDFWKLYYQAAAAKTDYRPADPAILRQNTVDKKAKLISTFEPDSNEYAQANGVAGLALYHVVIGADGKPGEIAVGRPIGFGLDENAVESIRKAQFQPAIKDGHPVPVLLDLVVQFRIYSKRTAVMSAPGSADQPAGPVLPGPYSLQQK
jgi:outer membrane biosynthesis protein TonB